MGSKEGEPQPRESPPGGPSNNNDDNEEQVRDGNPKTACGEAAEKTEAERKNGAAERRREELAEKRGIAAGVGGPRQDVRIKFQVQMGRGKHRERERERKRVGRKAD